MIDIAMHRHPRHTCILACVYVLGGLTTISWADDGAAQCQTCHPGQHDELAKSVHRALSCQECHAGAASYAVGADRLATFVSRADGSGMTFDHGASFMGKPTRSEIPDRCGNCHADVERMNPYGLRTDQLARYWTSNHGKRLKDEGDERVAVCVDCHGSHDIMFSHEPQSKTYPLNVPDTCGTCHADATLMADYDLPVEVLDEYRMSVHGRLLFEQEDTGAPTCATCHGNHSAMPPGFATVGAVCGQCHEHAAKDFATSIHADQEEHKGCVQCHGGGEDRHFHLIERITKPGGILLQRYAHLLSTEPDPSAEQITKAIHAEPKQIITHALPTCMECHEDLEDDESLPKLFGLLDEIAAAERYFVETARRLNETGKGVLLVDNQRFRFEDAKTHLIELAPLQHTLDNSLVAAKVTELTAVCDEVNADLEELEAGLRWRHTLLYPIWAFALFFATIVYVKYKQLKHIWVKPVAR